MPVCRVCKQELSVERFGITRRTLKTGLKKEYIDTTCMVCRRNSHLDKPGKRQIHRDGTKKWRENNPEQFKIQALRKYGITLEEYNLLREKQQCKCAICGLHETEVQQGKAKRTEWALHVDHDHETLKVRALLCLNCNNLIGKAKESTQILYNAIDYLNKYDRLLTMDNF